MSESANTAGSGRAHVNDNSCSDGEKGDGVKGGRLRDDLGGRERGGGGGGGGGADLQVKRAGTLGPLWPFGHAPRPDGLLKSFGAEKGNTAGVNTLPGGFHRSNELIWQIGEELVSASDGQWQ